MTAALAFLFLGVSCGGQAGSDSQIKLGAPPGASLILVDYVAAQMNITSVATPMLDIESFPDCCSANIQLALSSLSIDAALMCPDAAKALVDRDKRYIIVGACLANSDILVVKGDPASAQKIGVSQNHLYQTDIVNKLLGAGVATTAMSYAALSPAYEKGEVDGVVINIEGALLLQGTMLSAGGAKGDVVTYELVARKNLAGLERLKAAFSEASAALKDEAKLQAAIDSYGQLPDNGTEASLWMQHNIRFLTPA